MELYGWTAKELAESIGVEATAVYRSLALLRLPDDVAERVDAGEIKATAAYEIAKLQIADDQRAVAEAVVSGDLDHKATVEAVARRRAKPKGRGASKGKPKPLPTDQSVRVESGRRVTSSGRKGFDRAAFLSDLEEAVEMLRAELGMEQAA
jgi:hypothetical protein